MVIDFGPTSCLRFYQRNFTTTSSEYGSYLQEASLLKGAILSRWTGAGEAEGERDSKREGEIKEER
jgi:hypothetical protein